MGGSMIPETSAQGPVAIRGLVPMIHVQDVERSAARGFFEREQFD